MLAGRGGGEKSLKSGRKLKRKAIEGRFEGGRFERWGVEK